MSDFISILPQNLRTRFAPTPSGYLHIGNAFSFIITWLLAKVKNGKIVLRIDDLDTARMKKEYLEDIFKTLDWLKLTYDEGPDSPNNFLQNYSQTHRIEKYMRNVELLKNKTTTFYCQCSRKEIKAMSNDGQYPMTCRDKNLTSFIQELSLRVKTPKGQHVFINDIKGISKYELFKEMRDFVLLRKDGVPAYQIASLTDDLEQEINFIVRGHDLLLSSAAQVFLSNQLGGNLFKKVIFYHHPIIKNHEGKKLSKSAGDISIKYLRENGGTPSTIYEEVAKHFNFSKNSSESLDILLNEAFKKL